MKSYVEHGQILAMLPEFQCGSEPRLCRCDKMSQKRDFCDICLGKTCICLVHRLLASVLHALKEFKNSNSAGSKMRYLCLMV